MKNSPTVDCTDSPTRVLMQTSLKDFKGFVTRKFETPTNGDSLVRMHKWDEEIVEHVPETFGAQKSNMRTSILKRKSTGESSTARQPKEPKKPKPGASKSNDKSVSKGKSNENDDYDSDREAFTSIYEARSTGRKRKPRKQEGMVSWTDVDPVTGLPFSKETVRSRQTAISSSYGPVADDQDNFEDPQLGAHPGNRYDSLGMEMTPSIPRSSGRHRRPSSETERSQGLCSYLASHRHLNISVASSGPSRANNPAVVKHDQEDPATAESSEEDFPDVWDMVTSKTSAKPTVQDVLDKRRGKEVEREMKHEATSSKSELIEARKKTMRSNLLTKVDNTVFQDAKALSANVTTQPNTPTASDSLLPTPTSTIRSTSITPYHKTVIIRYWLITSTICYRQVRWREGTLRKKTLHSVINAIAQRLGMVDSTIKGLKCVLRAGEKEFSDAIAREDEAGFAEMKEYFNEEIEKTPTALGLSGVTKFDILLEPLKEFEGMRKEELDNDGEGWI